MDADAAPLRLSRIGQIAVPVTDLDRAIAPIRREMWQRLGLLSLLLAALGLAVERVFAVQRRSTRTLTQMANYDALTGLPNRRHAMRCLSSLWNESIQTIG